MGVEREGGRRGLGIGVAGNGGQGSDAVRWRAGMRGECGGGRVRHSVVREILKVQLHQCIRF